MTVLIFAQSLLSSYCETFSSLFPSLSLLLAPLSFWQTFFIISADGGSGEWENINYMAGSKRFSKLEKLEDNEE